MKNALLSILLAASVFAAPPRVFRDPFNDGTSRSGPALVAIPVTEGVVGSRADDRGHTTAEMRRPVRVSPFAIGQYEVTNAELCAFLNEAGNGSDQGIPWIDVASAKDIRVDGKRFVPAAGTENHPATGVTWRGARAYCRWLSKKSGASYDLPTGTQWELAARAGTSTIWWWGDADDPTRQHSIAAGMDGPIDVGSHAPNPWGIHDTAGNVWEWMLDCFVSDAPLLMAERDPVMLDERCLAPEIRGGSYGDGEVFSRPSYRANAWWTSRSPRLGFRVARRMAAAVVADKSTYTITWRRSGKPATVNLSTEGGRTRLVDPVSGLVVFEGNMPAGGVAVPEPIRIQGTIGGVSAGSPVTVRVGGGPRVAAMERWNRASGSMAPPDQRMTTAMGLVLPKSPLHWTNARMNGNSFVSEWVLADDAPQIVAFDAAGRVDVRDVALPAALEPHATIDAATIPLQPYAALDVDFPRPAGDLIAPMFFGVANAQIDPAAAADAGRFLSVADVVDPRLFGLLVAGHGCGVDPGATVHLSPMPPFTSLTLMTHEPVGSSTVSRVVKLAPGATAAVHLTTGNEVSFRSAPTGTFRGRVTMPFRGTPLAGATVVVSDYPTRRETTTDANGRFRVDGIRTDRAVSVLVDASKSGIDAPYAATQLFRGLPASAEAALVMTPPTTIQGPIPIPAAMLTTKFGGGEFPCLKINDTQYPAIIGGHDSQADTHFTVNEIHDSTMTIRACASGTWQFEFAPTPFQLFVGQGPITTAETASARLCPDACMTKCFRGDITFGPSVSQAVEKLILTFNRQLSSGGTFPLGGGALVEFAPPDQFAHDLSPTPILPNSDSQIILCHVIAPTLHVTVNAGQGGSFDCDVTNFRDGVCSIQLVKTGDCASPIDCGKK